MSEAEVVSKDAPAFHAGQRSRRRLAIGVLALLLLCLSPVVSLFWLWNKSLRDALAEADRLDPNWLIAELEANRAVVPDEQNSGVAVVAAIKLAPPQWPAWDLARPAPKGSDPSGEELDALQKRLHPSTVTPVLLGTRAAKLLREEWRRAKPILAEAHKVLQLPQGRYPTFYAQDYVGFITSYPPNLLAACALAKLFGCEAILHAQDQNMEGALQSCRGIFYAGRSIGDEPTLASMLARLSIQRVALSRIEQVLALGEAPETGLAALQHLLEEEEREPLLLTGLRGNRAMLDGLMQAIQKDDVQLAEVPGLVPSLRNDVVWFQGLNSAAASASIKNQSAALLRWHNRAVEIAKMPVEEQRAAFRELESSGKKLPMLARALALGPVWPPSALSTIKASEDWIVNQVWIRRIITLVAVERYRLAHGHWPAALTDLVPDYLPKVPIDVYDGAPVRFRRLPDGVAVYSVGEDGVDNGGNLDENPKENGTDWGVRLWDVSRRRQPPPLGE